MLSFNFLSTFSHTLSLLPAALQSCFCFYFHHFPHLIIATCCSENLASVFTFLLSFLSLFDYFLHLLSQSCSDFYQPLVRNLNYAKNFGLHFTTIYHINHIKLLILVVNIILVLLKRGMLYGFSFAYIRT